MFQEPDNRLSRAASDLGCAALKPEPLNRAETVVLQSFRPKQAIRFRGLVWTTAATAAAAASALLLLPSRSAAADLGRIFRNGDIGMRHVRAYDVGPDGSQKLNMEFYADGDLALLESPGEKIFWQHGRCTIAHDDGSTEVAQLTSKLAIWFNYSARQIIALGGTGKGLKVSVTRGLVLDGSRVDRYVLDVDTGVWNGQTVHRHSELYVDRATERPVRMQTDATGSPRELETWDYAPSPPGVWKTPPIDHSRLYDTDDENRTVREAPHGHGPSLVVAGQRVELVQLWMDDRGNAAAVTEANYPHPDNFSLRVDGKRIGNEPEDEDTTRHYYVHQPISVDGRSMELFYGQDSRAMPTAVPSVASVSVPVFADGKIAGFAEFHNIPVRRCWNVHVLLEGPGSPFAPRQGAAATAMAAPAESRP